MPNLNKLDQLFSPKSIAVIGASSDPDKVGHQIFKKLLRSNVKIYPVNLTQKQILGTKAYQSVIDIKDPIDQAIIAIPAPVVNIAVKQCLNKKIKSLVIITAGFSETGSTGAALEDQLKKLIKKSSSSVLGPNCLGYANPGKNLDITFALTPPQQGNIALISQSGAVGSYLFDWSKSENLGLSKFASLGNRADLNENDCLDYLSHDSGTKIIGLYLESFANGEQFLKTASRVSKLKPIIVLFGGQTRSGKKAASTHTASLSPMPSLISTALKQSGCIQAHSLSDFTGLLEVFSTQPPLKDKDIAILTNAGGPAILAADAVDKNQLHLSTLTDVLGDAVAIQFKKALINLTANSQNDAFLIIISPQTNSELELTARHISTQAKKIKKPVIVSLLGGDSMDKAEAVLKKHSLPTIEFPSEAVNYLKTLYQYYHYTYHRKLTYPARAAHHQPKSHPLLLGPQSWQSIQKIARLYDLPLVKTLKVKPADLDFLIKDFGWPLVLKSDPAESLHRTEVKGLYLNLNSPDALKKAYYSLSKSFLTVLAQPQMKQGHELFIGFQHTNGFPPMITVGSGGIYTEVYHDVANAFLPLNKTLTLQLIKQTKIGQILSGVRQQDPINLTKVIDLILNLSFMIQDNPQIKSLDINPAIITHDSIKIVDIKLIAG